MVTISTFTLESLYNGQALQSIATSLDKCISLLTIANIGPEDVTIPKIFWDGP